MITFILEVYCAIQKIGRSEKFILIWALVDLLCLFLLVLAYL